MKSSPFKYLAVSSAEEAAAALKDYGDEAKILAGGQSLLPLLAMRLAFPMVLIDVGRTAMNAISANGSLSIGAVATQNQALSSSVAQATCPLLCESLRHVAHHAIRNRGTVGGAIAHADPAAELPAVLLATGGSVEVTGPDGSRTIAADDMFQTLFTTAMADDEVLTDVRFNSTPVWAFHEITRRGGDYALAGVAATFLLDDAGTIETARVALFSVADRPVRSAQAEESLVGQRLDDAEAIAVAAALAAGDVNPSADMHGSTEYRKRLVEVAVRRALTDSHDERVQR